MTHNDILRRLRFMFGYNDTDVIKVFAAAEHEVTKDQIRHWLAKEDDAYYIRLEDVDLASFLNGLINQKRGKRPGPQPLPETHLNNNVIATKLKIALNLKGEEIIEILKHADFRLGPHELSAFFRKPGNRQYRPMQDQVLRYFLRGLQIKLRPMDDDNSTSTPS